MPLPSPKGKEVEKDFIGRCMGDSMMNKEYPDQKQRAAVCYTQWRESKAEEKSTKSSMSKRVSTFVSCRLSTAEEKTDNILKGVIVCQIGDVHPSVGPEFFLDEEFLDQLVEICAGQSRKVRINHGAGVLSIIGTANNFRKDMAEVEGKMIPCVRADIELLDGDAFKTDREKIKTYAEKMPEFFGMSLDMAIKLTKKVINGLKVAMLAAVEGVDFVDTPAATNALLEEKVDSPEKDKSTKPISTMKLSLDAEYLKKLGMPEDADEKTIKAGILDLAIKHGEMKEKLAKMEAEAEAEAESEGETEDEKDMKEEKSEEEAKKSKSEAEAEADDKGESPEEEKKEQEAKKASASKNVTLSTEELEEAIAKGVTRVLASHALKPKVSAAQEKQEKASTLTSEQKTQCAKMGVKEEDFIKNLEKFHVQS